MIGHRAATAAIVAAVGGLGILAVSLAADLAVERAGLRVFSIRTASVLAADYSSDPIAPLPPLSAGIIEDAEHDDALARISTSAPPPPGRAAATPARPSGSTGPVSPAPASAVPSATSAGTKAPASATGARASETPRPASTSTPSPAAPTATANPPTSTPTSEDTATPAAPTATKTNVNTPKPTNTSKPTNTPKPTKVVPLPTRRPILEPVLDLLDP